MNTRLFVGSLLAITVLLGGCVSAVPTSTSTALAPSTSTAPAPSTSTPTAPATGAGLGLEAAPWQNGSTASYQWVDDASGEQIGTSEFTFASEDGEWVITEDDSIGELEQKIEMRINLETLAPLGETKTITTSNTNAQITTSYENGKLNITAVVNGKTSTASIDVPSNALDNDQLLMTLRALPFAEGYTADYVAVVAQNALKVDTTVTVLAAETIEVPAGSFESWHVELQASQSTQNAWYQVDPPHMLVQYDNGVNRMVLVK
jgi:PBP1b-binding outer membrane lipoprotein LpoB